MNFLEETEITKILKSCIKKLKQAQIQEQDLQSSLDSSNQELQATCQNSEKSVGSHLHPSKWKPMNIGSASKSSEMILAVEVLRKELHRCTGLILDCLLKHTESDSNEQSVSFLLELYERSFRDLHESLNTSWVAVNEFEILLRSTKEPSRMRLLSGWISSWFPPLLGAVIGSAATNLFATLRDETAELEYYRIPFVRNRSASKSGNGDNRDECQHVCQSDFHVHESSRGDKSKSTKLTQNNEEITTFITDVHGTPPHSRRQSPSQARDSSELVKSLKPAYRSDFEEELERSRIRFESRLLESTPSESTAYKPGASDGYSAAFSGSLLGAAVLIGSSGGTGMGLSSGSHDIGGLGMRDEYWMCCQCCMVEGGYRCSQCRHSRCHNCRWWRPPLENPNGRTY